MATTDSITYQTKTASAQEILVHLEACDAAFVPSLSSRVNLEAYALKMAEKATTFEAWVDGKLVGMIAAYLNDAEKRAFITNVSVMTDYKQHGLASTLLQQCKDFARGRGYEAIWLEVHQDNVPAVRFYTKHQFAQTDIRNGVWTMSYQVNP